MTTAPTVSVDTGTATATLDLTVDSRGRRIIRIQASDLAAAQTQRARVRRAAVDAGDDPDLLSIVVDVDFHIAADARTARKELANSTSVPVPTSLLYVGTASGLAVLIADVKAADVADGVVLRSILGRPDVLVRVVDEVLPWLASRNVVVDNDAVTTLLAGAGIDQGRRSLAS